MPPQRTVRSTTRTQDNQWNTLKQCELFCKKGACIVLFERRAVCCFMFGTGLVCKSMLMRVSRKERFLASAEMNAAGQKCLPDLHEPKAKRGTWGQLPFPSLICSEVLTGFRIFRPVIDQMHTHIHTHIYLLLVYRSDWIRFIYIIIDKQKHIMAYHSQKYQKYCAPISGLMPFARTSRWNFKTFSVVMSLQSGFLCYHLFSVSNCNALSAISFKSLIVLFLAGTRCWGLLKPGESPKSWVGPMGPMRTSSRLPQVSAFALAKEHMRQRMGQWSVPSMLASTCLDMSQPHFV